MPLTTPEAALAHSRFNVLWNNKEFITYIERFQYKDKRLKEVQSCLVCCHLDLFSFLAVCRAPVPFLLLSQPLAAQICSVCSGKQRRCRSLVLLMAAGARVSDRIRRHWFRPAIRSPKT